MQRLDWYFDFISPYAYLQHETLDRLPSEVTLRYKPLLFAGLLNHWGHRGPAEIPSKRAFTYYQVLWRARKAGIPMTLPPAHPFNPIKPLRLAIACGNRPPAVARIFRFIWREGLSCEDRAAFAALCGELGVEDPDRALSDPEVKRALIDNGREAIDRGVFGVPTFLAGEALFWGHDAMDMLLDYLEQPQGFAAGEMGRVKDLPIGVSRMK